MNQDQIIIDESSLTDLLNPLLKVPAEIKSFSIIKQSRFIYKTIHKADKEEYENDGWLFVKNNIKTVRMKKEKTHDVYLEDRVWTLFYKMGYSDLNGDKFNISFFRDDNSKGHKQIDVFACDGETAVVVECKSKATRGRRTLQKDLHETILLKRYIKKSIHDYYNQDRKPTTIWIYVTNNIIWSSEDIQRAKSGNIIVLTENELEYYEAFIMHMGPAGKYQILAEFLKNKNIPGLIDVKIPAIKGKIGGEIFYSFVTTPRALLKIAFVNHQALNHPDGCPAYQRMISSNRIKEIGKFIENGGYFPTNILINFINEPKFTPLSNTENTDPNLKFGWIELPKQFRSAWIIDGQHRLYGYSKIDDKFLDQSLFVLAFNKMDTLKEADLFITINNKQKRVPKGLLVSLLADIRLGSDDPKIALTALASAVVRNLNTDNTSPFFRRFAMPGIPPSSSQNLTISEVVNGLNRSQLLGKVIDGQIFRGPLTAGTDERTIIKAKKIINMYFNEIMNANTNRWVQGRTAYICVNPGIRAHLLLIAEIIKYIELKKRIDFYLITEESFVKEISNIAEPVFEYIKNAKDSEILNSFSRKFGEGGVKEYFFKLCEIINLVYSDFGSDEFKNYIDKKDDIKVEEADNLIIKLTNDITNYVIEVLKRVYGTHRMPSGDYAFWELGIDNKAAKEKAYKKQQEDSWEKRLPKEAYLDIVDIKTIIQQSNNWIHFESVFNIALEGEKKGKKYYTSWIDKFNELRRIPAHKSALRTYSDADFEFLDYIRAEFYDRYEKNHI